MTTQAIELYRSVPRYLTARAVGDRLPASQRAARADAVRQPQGRRAARAGLGSRSAAAVRDLRLGPRDDRREIELLLLAARLAAVRPRPRGRRRAPRRRRRPPAGHPDRARTGPELPRPRPRPLPELRGRPHRPLRPRHHRPRERRPADRLLRRHRRRLEQDVRRAPLAAPPGARRLSESKAVLLEPLSCASTPPCARTSSPTRTSS